MLLKINFRSNSLNLVWFLICSCLVYFIITNRDRKNENYTRLKPFEQKSNDCSLQESQFPAKNTYSQEGLQMQAMLYTQSIKSFKKVISAHVVGPENTWKEIWTSTLTMKPAVGWITIQKKVWWQASLLKSIMKK